MRKSLHTEEYKILCGHLVQLRKKAKLTQRDLAKRIKRESSLVARFETAERRLDVLEFVTVCRALGTDPVTVLKELIGELERKHPTRFKRVQ